MSSDAAYLRDQSARCRRLARAMLDHEGKARLIELADSYERQAAELAAARRDDSWQRPAPDGGPLPA